MMSLTRAFIFRILSKGERARNSFRKASLFPFITSTICSGLLSSAETDGFSIAKGTRVAIDFADQPERCRGRTKSGCYRPFAMLTQDAEYAVVNAFDFAFTLCLFVPCSLLRVLCVFAVKTFRSIFSLRSFPQQTPATAQD